MANKKVSQLTSKPSVLTTDLVPIADPSTGQLFKTTLSALGAVIGSAVASVNGLVGVVVLDTDDIQELASPTNRWFTDTRARAALSAGTGISYNSGTGVISSSVTLADLGGVPTSRTLTINGTSFDLSANRSWSIDSMVYPGAGIPISTGTAWGTSITNNSANWNTAYGWGNHAGLYLPIGGGTLTGNLILSTGSNKYIQIGSGASYYWRLRAFDNDFEIIAGDNSFTALKFYYPNGAATFNNSVTATSFIKTGGTSSGFLKADGSVDLRTFVTTGSLDNYLPLSGGSLTNSLSSGYVLSVTNTTESAGANGLYVNIASGSTGTPFRVDRGGVSLISVNYLGATLFKSTVTANSFIKSSGTSSEFLKADGSVDSTTYLTSGALSGYLPLSGGTLTGALGGTSASFSSTITSLTGTTGARITLGGFTNYGVIQDANSVNRIWFENTGSFRTIFDLPAAGTSFVFRDSDGNIKASITSAGAATFSSSVTATSLGINVSSIYGKFEIAGSANTYATAPAITFTDTAGTGDSNRWIVGNIATDYGSFNIASAPTPSSTTWTPRITILKGGNVGIGTTTDAGFKLDVNGSGRFSSGIVIPFNYAISFGSSPYRYSIYRSSAGAIVTYFDDEYNDPGTALKFRMRTSGTPIEILTLNSSGASSFGGSVTATSFFESSDKRLKTLIADNYEAKGIENIKPKLYTKNGVTELGYYAQDVQGILPSAVTTGADGFLNLSYREVHTAKIARLEKRVEELEAQLNLV